jgi:hypothetical protein
MVELAVSRGCTAKAEPGSDSHTDGDIQEGATGWPGMMSVRVHETDGVYDHPILPLAGEALQVVELQCHSKVAAKRFQKTKKGSKPDGSDDNVDASTQENRMRSILPNSLFFIPDVCLKLILDLCTAAWMHLYYGSEWTQKWNTLLKSIFTSLFRCGYVSPVKFNAE